MTEELREKLEALEDKCFELKLMELKMEFYPDDFIQVLEALSDEELQTICNFFIGLTDEKTLKNTFALGLERYAKTLAINEMAEFAAQKLHDVDYRGKL